MDFFKNFIVSNQEALMAMLLYMLSEYIMGVTNKVKSNSFPELVLRGLGRLIKLFLPSRFIMAKRKGLR
jgi:hypothetical protein